MTKILFICMEKEDLTAQKPYDEILLNKLISYVSFFSFFLGF